MSGMVSPKMRAQAEQLGYRSFLAKPFTTNDLMLSVQESLEVVA
jgi:CheY-like chemotaxis protein